jgi:outer membrane protein OmpU
MKKILLASTILAASAGFASAEITFGGSAAAGIASQAGGDLETYSSANLAVTFAGQTDSGLSFGASFDTTAGRSYTLGDGDDFADEGGTFGMPTIFVSGSFGKVSFSDDNFDFFDDTNGGGDVKYEGTFGGFGVGLIADVDVPSAASVMASYTIAGVALSANADTYNLWNVSAAYTMGSITATVGTDEASNSYVEVAYAANGISASAQYNTSDASVDVAAGYSANGISVNADTNSVSNAWTVTGSYDLGGGLTLEAGTNYTSDLMIGASMSF